jgi:hypothetical protein
MTGVKNITWSGCIASNQCGVCVNWQWAAAVYKCFSTNLNDLGIKPADDNHLGPYYNSDQAGTPEFFRNYVTGGARGGGGSNFTGSLSGTQGVCAEFCKDCGLLGQDP